MTLALILGVVCVVGLALLLIDTARMIRRLDNHDRDQSRGGW